MERNVQLYYFKWTGKFYTEAETQIEDNTELPPPTSGAADIASMYVICEKIRQMQSEGKLPGLREGTQWKNGFIYANCEEGYPCLIVPEVAKKALEQELDDQ